MSFYLKSTAFDKREQVKQVWNNVCKTEKKKRQRLFSVNYTNLQMSNSYRYCCKFTVVNRRLTPVLWHSTQIHLRTIIQNQVNKQFACPVR